MKKLMAIILLAAMITLTSCDNNNTSEDTGSREIDITTVETTTEKEPTDDKTPDTITDDDVSTQSVIGFDDLTDITNYWIEIDGVRINIGDSFSDVLDAGFGVSKLQEDIPSETTLEPMQMTFITFQKFNDDGTVVSSLSSRIINTTDDDTLVKDGIVFSLSLNEFDANRFESVKFINGIEIGTTTKDEIEEMFGDPDQLNETAVLTSMTFFHSTRISYRFTFDTETGVLA
jgi:hypothetical protein